MKNLDEKTVEGFGREWSSFDQSGLNEQEKRHIFNEYFHLFPWDRLPEKAAGLDLGCGSGRWASLVAPRVARLFVLDASPDALQVARGNLAGFDNCRFHEASVDRLPFDDASLDFAYSLGVLHHVPDTLAAIRETARTLKPGAPFLIYLYYAFDNRPWWFRNIWKTSDLLRRLISAMPYALRLVFSQIMAAAVYLPLALSGRALHRLGKLPSTWPLRYYWDKSFYVMRTDALDRFGTRLEQRFTRREIRDMLVMAGFEQICFSDHAPFWVAIAVKS